MTGPFKIKGRLTYDPTRRFKEQQLGWLTVEFKAEDLTAYYRWFIEKNWWQIDSGKKREYHRPPHPPHVSIIRGERLRANQNDWGKYMAGAMIEFEYDGDIKRTSMERDGKDHFFFLSMLSPKYNELRSHYGLDTERGGVKFKGHMTIARVF